MAYKMYLTDANGIHELPETERPLTITPVEKSTVNEPLSGNVYTDYLATKRQFTHTWAYLTKDEYADLLAIYDLQKSTWTYPRLSLPDKNISDLVVQFALGAENIIDDCGNVQGVTVSFRETRQIGS